jgi:hypothetical protein
VVVVGFFRWCLRAQTYACNEHVIRLRNGGGCEGVEGSKERLLAKLAAGKGIEREGEKGNDQTRERRKKESKARK